MKILLVQPFNNDRALSGESYPPVGLGYLASSVRKSEHSVYILDCLKDCKGYEDFIKRVKDISPEVLGFNLFSISVPFVIKMTDMVKSEMPGMTIVLGGPHVSALPDKTLNRLVKADFAIRGEGEIPLRKLVDYLEKGNRSYNEIPGLIYRKNGNILVNEPCFASDIEEYGFPAWDLIDPSEYFKYLSMGNDAIPVFFSRGCPFPCTFCAAKVTSGRRLRRRSFDHIFEELSLLQNEYGIKKFVIEDEGFGVSRSFILRFCERVKKENFKATFAMGVGMRLDQVGEELLEAMSSSGFEKTIVLGIESGSERILKLMKKKINLKLIWEKIKLMREVGFIPNGYFILGYPGETKEDMEQTIQLALKLPIDEASFTAFQPLPATEATNMLIERGELPQDYDFSYEIQNSISYAPQGMTKTELERLRKRAILKFYLRPKILFQYLRSKQRFKHAAKKFQNIFLKSNILR